jgi:hypothetical protein
MYHLPPGLENKVSFPLLGLGDLVVTKKGIENEISSARGWFPT